MKKRNSILLTLTFTLVFGIWGQAHALLFSRLGGDAVYDDDLDVTWLSDANSGAGSTFDDGFSSTDGRMTWQSANDWATSLTVGGYTDWRLPTTLQPDASCDSQSGSISFGYNCTGSEMGHLFYNELGGTARSSILSSGDPDLSLLSNIQADWYWSGTEFAPNPNAWVFNFNTGNQNALHKLNDLHAWALRSGDVGAAPAPVPEPGTIVLLGSGLFGLVLYRKRLHR